MSFYNGILNHYDESGLANIKGARGSPGIGFKLDLNNDYDMQNKKLVNVDDGDNNQDVVNKHQLDVGLQTKPNKTDVLLLDGTTHMVGDLDLRGNKIISPGEIQMDRKLITNLDTDENQDLSDVNMITLKNKVEPKANKDYVDFEITKQNALINNTFVKKTGDVLTGDLILPHDNYPVQGNTNKAVSYETQREIFLSRKESFPMQADINMNNNFIQNVATPTTSHQEANKGYCDYNFLNRQKGGRIMGSLSMNQNDLFEIPAPKFGSSAVNKNYVDGEISKITTVDTNQFVLKSGSTMTGNLNMNGSNIKNVGINLSDDTTAVPRSYVDSFVNSVIHNPLDGDLYANNHQIKNLKTPSEDNDAVTKKYFEDQLLQSHLLPSHKENAFKYLLNRDESSSEQNITVNGIVDYDGSPHKNKKAYDIDLIYTRGTQNYDSQIGINIYPLPIGKFTIIMEYYYPENIGITVSCQASTAIINKQTSKNFTGYIKLLVQFEDQTKQTPDYLYFDIRGSGTTSTNPEGYLVFYGMKEWYDSINPKIYDHALETSMFGYDNGNMKMFTDLDMNNNKIINFVQPTDYYKKNFTYLKYFTDRFYDLKEPSKYRLTILSRQHVVTSIDPDLSISYSGNKYITVGNLNPTTGLQFDNTMKIIIDVGYVVNRQTSFTIMISFTLKDDFKIYFVEPQNEQIAYYPKYNVNKSALNIDIETASNIHKKKSFSNKFDGQQILLMIHHTHLVGHFLQLVGGASVIYSSSTPQPSFSTRKIRIDPGKNIINKICYQNKNILSDELDVAQILFAEKKDGTHFE